MVLLQHKGWLHLSIKSGTTHMSYETLRYKRNTLNLFSILNTDSQLSGPKPQAQEN